MIERLITPEIFQRFQKPLVFFANTWLGHRYFRIRDGKNRKISEVGPAFIRFNESADLVTCAEARAMFAGWKGIDPSAVTCDTGETCHGHELKSGKAEFRTNEGYLFRVRHTFRIIELLAFALAFTQRQVLIPLMAGITTTFYPDTGEPGAAGEDAFLESHDATYSTSQSGAALSVIGGTSIQWGQQWHGSGQKYIWRSYLGFLTSSLGGGAHINSAILSLYGNNKLDSASVSPTTGIVAATPANPAQIATTDWANFGSTTFATIVYSSFSTSAYNDFTLDANGIANITGSGVSKFGVRTNIDISATSPAGVATQQLYAYAADQTGTSNDPKLVIDYNSLAGGFNFSL